MCTGFTFQAKNGDVILGRTMDYDYPLTGHPAVQPRHYYWESRVDYKGTTTYGFTGAGSDMEGFIFGDGKMSMASQYLINMTVVMPSYAIKYTIHQYFTKLKY